MRALLITVSLVLVVTAAGIGALALMPAPQTQDSMTLVIETGSISTQRTAESEPNEQPTGALGTSVSQADDETAQARGEPTLDDVIAARLEEAGRRREARDQQATDAEGSTARLPSQPAQPATQPGARQNQAGAPADPTAGQADFAAAQEAQAPAGTVSITQMLAAELNEDSEAEANGQESASAEPAESVDSPTGENDQTISASLRGETDAEPAAQAERSASESEINIASLPRGMTVQPGASPETAPAGDAAAVDDPATTIIDDEEEPDRNAKGDTPESDRTPLAAGEAPALPAQRGAFRVKGRIALLIRGLGVNGDLTARTIEALPSQVALGFVPYGENLTDWTQRARSGGHDVLIQIPLEPENYPETNPGPHTLLTSLSIDENLKRLDWLLDRFEGITGVSNYLGGKFAKAPGAFAPVMMELKARELIYVDDGKAANPTARQLARQVSLDYAIADNVLDEPRRNADELAEALKQVEAVARSDGKAIVVGHAHAETLAALKDWIAGLSDRGLVLEPIENLLAAPPARQVSQTTDG